EHGGGGADERRGHRDVGRLAHGSKQVNCEAMRSPSSRIVRVGIGGSLLTTVGCSKPAEPAATTDEAPEPPAEPAPPKPAGDPAAPSEPSPEPEVAPPTEPAKPSPTEPSAGEGFELGARPEAREGQTWAQLAEPLRHAGVTVSVTPDVIEPVDDEGEFGLNMQVRVEFEGADAKLGLNHVRSVEGSY